MPVAPTADKLTVDYTAETFALSDGVEAFSDAACTNKVNAGSVTAYLGQTLYIRYAESGTDVIIPASAAAVQIDAKVKVTFMVDGEEYATHAMRSGATLTDIPTVPSKENAGEQVYAGGWYSDEQGSSLAVFTNITADMTVYAVYTTGYTVTLKGGAGYTLSAVNGSTSPVKEGGSFTFRFALSNGYTETGDLAVKVNDNKVELVSEGSGVYTYTITNIQENKTVTVTGVQKKQESGGTNNGDTDKDQNQSGTSGDNSSDNNSGGDNSGSDDNSGRPTGSDNSGGGNNGGQPTGSNNSGSTDNKQPGAADGTQPTGNTQPTGDNKPSGTDDNKPGGTDGTQLVDNDMSDTDDKKPDGVDSKKPTDGTQSTGNDSLGTSEPQNVPVVIKEGRIIISGGTTGAIGDGAAFTDGRIFTGTTAGMISASTVLQIVDGSSDGSSTGMVIVTVVCEEQACTAGVADTVAVANAVLTAEQLELVGSGETIEIRIDVTDISANVP